MSGSMEEQIYNLQVNKQSRVHRVIDEQQIDRHFSAAEVSDLYNFNRERMTRPASALPQGSIAAVLLRNMASFIYSTHDHSALLKTRQEEALTAEEKAAAWIDYVKESNTPVLATTNARPNLHDSIKTENAPTSNSERLAACRAAAARNGNLFLIILSEKCPNFNCDLNYFTTALQQKASSALPARPARR